MIEQAITMESTTVLWESFRTSSGPPRMESYHQQTKRTMFSGALQRLDHWCSNKTFLDVPPNLVETFPDNLRNQPSFSYLLVTPHGPFPFDESSAGGNPPSSWISRKTMSCCSSLNLSDWEVGKVGKEEGWPQQFQGLRSSENARKWCCCL